MTEPPTLQSVRPPDRSRWSLAFAFVLGAFSTAVVSGWLFEPAGEPQPTQIAAASPVASAPARTARPTSTDPTALDLAIRFRQDVGLRADPTYVLGVIADPAAETWPFEVALLPSELAMLHDRPSAAVDVEAAIRAYGETRPDVYAGVFREGGSSRVQALFVGDPAEIRPAILKLVWPEAGFDVVRARYSLERLESLVADLAADADWFAAEGATFRSAKVITETNRVYLTASGAPEGDEPAIWARFDADPVMLEIQLHADDRAYLPRGSLSGRLVDAAGRAWEPGRNLDVRAIGELGAYEPDGGVGIATELDGTFNIERLAEMSWIIQIEDSDSGLVLGSASVEVRGGERAEVEVVVEP